MMAKSELRFCVLINFVFHPSSDSNLKFLDDFQLPNYIFSCLVTAPILPAWLWDNQHFIKAIQVTTLNRVEDHCPTATSSPYR